MALQRGTEVGSRFAVARGGDCSWEGAFSILFCPFTPAVSILQKTSLGPWIKVGQVLRLAGGVEVGRVRGQSPSIKKERDIVGVELGRS